MLHLGTERGRNGNPPPSVAQTGGATVTPPAPFRCAERVVPCRPGGAAAGATAGAACCCKTAGTRAAATAIACLAAAAAASAAAAVVSSPAQAAFVLPPLARGDEVDQPPAPRYLPLPGSALANPALAAGTAAAGPPPDPDAVYGPEPPPTAAPPVAPQPVERQAGGMFDRFKSWWQ